MDYKKIEQKWQKRRKEQGAYAFDKARADKKYYVLEMFSYPSGSNLHIGHWYNYGPSDTFARFKKMQGYEVFQPMGFDAFGLPAENYAIKTGIHPQDSTEKNIAVMEKQLAGIGAMYEPNSSLVTCMPDYYRWTQWLFLQFYNRGLVYRKESPVNWCTSCNTVIANEQVVDGKCERCEHEVVRKNLTQWFFKITDYAEELLTGLDNLDWPEKTKAMQRNWIGKSVGGEISFPLEDGLGNLTVFTTRPDTLMGVSYVVLAPEHPLVDKLTATAQREAVEAYKYAASKISDIERTSSAGGKTGVFTGAHCAHPVTGERVPVWIADYCLATYGTGAVMGVPAHDTRDYEFAQKYDLPIKRVIKAESGKNDDLPFTEYGVLVNSGKFDGMTSENTKKAVLDFLQGKDLGKTKINYRLRDWSVSRQRYWGCPIPIVYCDKCGAVPVPESDLPVKLPYDVNFTPDGKSPLTKHEGFMDAVCPKCGKKARREADTLDTFVDSSWYFLRYPDSRNEKQAFDPALINKILPVDKYIGGAEHACMHLLYSRFFVKALRDMGYLTFDEPFKSLVHQGTILGTDGEKMSKSKGNVVNPDAYTSQYGSDVLRMYLMFGFSYIEGGPWNDEGIKAINKFLERVERIVETSSKAAEKAADIAADKDLAYALNYAIKHVTADLEVFSFNTAIARLMELVNAMYKYTAAGFYGTHLRDTASSLITLLAPFAPHFAEELNELHFGGGSVFDRTFPVCDESKLKRDEVEIAVQINSRIVSRIMISSDFSNEETVACAVKDEKVSEALAGRPLKNSIVIKNRLVNLIV